MKHVIAVVNHVVYLRLTCAPLCNYRKTLGVLLHDEVVWDLEMLLFGKK